MQQTLAQNNNNNNNTLFKVNGSNLPTSRYGDVLQRRNIKHNIDKPQYRYQKPTTISIGEVMKLYHKSVVG